MESQPQNPEFRIIQKTFTHVYGVISRLTDKGQIKTTSTSHWTKGAQIGDLLTK